MTNWPRRIYSWRLYYGIFAFHNFSILRASKSRILYYFTSPLASYLWIFLRPDVRISFSFIKTYTYIWYIVKQIVRHQLVFCISYKNCIIVIWQPSFSNCFFRLWLFEIVCRISNIWEGRLMNLRRALVINK